MAGAYKDVEVAADAKGHWQVEQDFVDGIREHRLVHLTTFDVALRYMQFTSAVHASYHHGNAVCVQTQ